MCAECDASYGLVTREVNKLSELVANISSVADSILSYNMSAITSDTFYDRLQQTRTRIDKLVSSVSCIFRVSTATTTLDKRAIFLCVFSDNLTVTL